MYNSLHLGAGVDRLYIRRKERERRQVCTEDAVCVEESESQQVYRC